MCTPFCSLVLGGVGRISGPVWREGGGREGGGEEGVREKGGRRERGGREGGRREGREGGREGEGGKQSIRTSFKSLDPCTGEQKFKTRKRSRIMMRRTRQEHITSETQRGLGVGGGGGVCVCKVKLKGTVILSA